MSGNTEAFNTTFLGNAKEIERNPANWFFKYFNLFLSFSDDEYTYETVLKCLKPWGQVKQEEEL